MHTLEIRLEGEFYDSYIYLGKLYLWTLDHRLISVEWDALVESLVEQPADSLALECAFQKSSLLYQSSVSHVLRDEELRPVVVEKFNRLRNKPWELSRHEWSKFLTHEEDNPVPFPHADVTVYLKQLFVCSSHGIWRGDLRTAKSKPLTNRNLDFIWDAPSFDIACWNRIMAVASGGEGAFQMSVDADDWLGVTRNPQQITDANTQSVEWLFGSIFCSSSEGGVFLDYTPYRENDEGSRKLRHSFEADQLFEEDVRGRYAWGAKEKLCAASTTSVAVTKYNQYAAAEEERLDDLGEFRFDHPLSSIPIQADSSYFGYVLETETGMVVVASNGENLWIEGEPVNWRLFRTSIDYVNQLHVARDSHLSILSFNDDYLVNQPDKRIGLTYRSTDRRQQQYRRSGRAPNMPKRPRLRGLEEVDW